jgi:UDP-2,4-diacetamido-2,4,6-trideoxy-beta-L-altropyranose hydrolase
VRESAAAAVAFRTTASKRIGSGHLQRCLTLARELRSRLPSDAPVRFWIDGDQAARAAAEASGFAASLVAAEEPATTIDLLRAVAVGVLVVDSYSVPSEAFTRWRGLARAGLVVLDDLADRALDVDVVINGSPHAADLEYRTAPDALKLLGPAYALLRPHFRDLAPHEVRPTVSRVLVTLGGADPHGSTSGVVEAVRRALPDARLDVVIGSLFGDVPELERMAAREPALTQLHRGVTDLSTLMAEADVAVSGGGQTLYELAASGLPTVAVCLADNQEGNIAALDGVTLLRGGRAPEAAIADYREVEDSCRRLGADPTLRARLSRAGQGLIDGRGASRAADAILSLLNARGAVR